MNTVKRHGDMIFERVDASAIEGLQSKSRENLTVGLGEVSGHAHNLKPFEGAELVEYHESFDNEDSQDFILRDKTYFEVKAAEGSEHGAVVHHEDHDPILFEPGVYVRIIQQTYDPLEDQIRRVVD